MTEEAIGALHDYVAQKQEAARQAEEARQVEKARQLRQQTIEAIRSWREQSGVDTYAYIWRLLASDDPGTGPLRLVRGVEFWHESGGYYDPWKVRRAGYGNQGKDPLELLAQVYAHLDAQAEKEWKDREAKLANCRAFFKGEWGNRSWPSEVERVIVKAEELLPDPIPADWSALFAEARQRAEDYQREREEATRLERERREAEAALARQEELEYQRKQDLRQRALWYPFRVWQVEYGFAGQGEEEPYIDFFYALSPTPVEHRGTPGWFTDKSGAWVQVPNPVRVVEVDVAEPNYQAMVRHPEYGVWMPPVRAEGMVDDALAAGFHAMTTLNLETCQEGNKQDEMSELQRQGENWHLHASGQLWRWVPMEWLKETEEEATE